MNTADVTLQAWKGSGSSPSAIPYTEDGPKMPVTFTEVVCLTCFETSSSKRRKEKAAIVPVNSLPRCLTVLVAKRLSLLFSQGQLTCQQWTGSIRLVLVKSVSCFYHFNMLQALMNWLPNHLFQNNSRNCCCTAWSIILCGWGFF